MDDKNLIRKVMTYKSGKFPFSGNFGNESIYRSVIEADVYYQTIVDLPILPQLASRLDEELIIRSIFGTAAIEGNPLKEEEVAELLASPDSAETTKKAEKEILNLRRAYGFASRVSSSESGFELTEDVIKRAHEIITGGIEHETNIPGKYRHKLVKVGNAEHGGIYTPPKILDDIKTLMKEFAEWINSEEVTATGPYVRAGLAHYHFALIHPFSDGNGRTARLIEGMLLNAGEIRYLPTKLSNYYYRNVDDYYWAFSKSMKSKEYDISPFMEFFLTGVVESLKEMKESIIFFIRKFALGDYYAFLRKEKGLSKRQHDLMLILLEQPQMIALSDLFEKPTIKPLYEKVSQRTAQRDLKKLVDMKLLDVVSGEYTLNHEVLG